VKFALEKMGDRKFQNQDESKALMRNALIGGSVEIVKLLQARNIPLSFGPDIRSSRPTNGTDTGKENIWYVERTAFCQANSRPSCSIYLFQIEGRQVGRAH